MKAIVIMTVMVVVMLVTATVVMIKEMMMMEVMMLTVVVICPGSLYQTLGSLEINPAVLGPVVLILRIGLRFSTRGRLSVCADGPIYSPSVEGKQVCLVQSWCTG